MPSLGPRPRRCLAGPHHAFPDGHSGLCGSLKTQPYWEDAAEENSGCSGFRAPPCAWWRRLAVRPPSHPSFQVPHLELCREESAPVAAGSFSSFRPDARELGEETGLRFSVCTEKLSVWFCALEYQLGEHCLA